MRRCAVGLILTTYAWAQQSDIPKMTGRLAEEAEVFAHVARAVLSEEKLAQRTRKPVPRFHPRVGDSATKLKDEFLTREIVSEGNTALRAALQGVIWVRNPDYLPLRIKLLSARKEGAYVVNTEATVDYAMSPHGCILPAAVVHRDTVAGKLITENLFQYAPFRKFGADSELKFDVPAEPPK